MINGQSSVDTQFCYQEATAVELYCLPVGSTLKETYHGGVSSYAMAPPDLMNSPIQSAGCKETLLYKLRLVKIPATQTLDMTTYTFPTYNC